MKFDIHHHYHNPWGGAQPWAEEMLGLILINQEQIMTAIDDLKAAYADLHSAVTDAVAEVDALVAKVAAVPGVDPEVVAITQEVKDETAALRGALKRAAPPPDVPVAPVAPDVPPVA